jgi:hypothetical protein
VGKCVDLARTGKLRLVIDLKFVKVFVISSALVCFAKPSIVVTCQQAPATALQVDNATVIRNIDAAVKWRVDHIAEYTDTEHYKVYRGGNEKTPLAEMVVKTTYRPESGKDYQVLSHSGSSVIYKLLLQPALQTEHDINLPSKVGVSYLTSANYNMQLKSGEPIEQDGRLCWAVAVSPKHKAPNLIDGTIWVEVRDFTIVRLEGVTSKSATFVASPAHVMRQYTNISGFAQATHARAQIDSLFGKVVITIDYEGYQIQTR